MNVLDENIIESQRQFLRSWRIRVKQIGHEIGRPGMKDDEIISLLHRIRRVTFFTRDSGFYEARPNRSEPRARARTQALARARSRVSAIG